MKKENPIRESRAPSQKDDNPYEALPYIDSEMNLRLAKWFGLLILLAILFLTILLALTSGCVSLAKETYHDITYTPPPTTIPTAAPIVQPFVEATPEPEPTLPYDLWKYTAKQYNMSEWYTIERVNVSGYGAINIKTTVYRIRAMDNYYTWEWYWGGPTDGSADWANIPDRGNKFVFVWVCQYLEGEQKIWGTDERDVFLEINGTIYTTDNAHADLTAPIREFENLPDFGNVVRTSPYGYDIIQNLKDGKRTAQARDWLYPGFSNRWDGWIIYQVPRDADLSHAKVHITLMHLGKEAYWTVTPMDGY